MQEANTVTQMATEGTTASIARSIKELQEGTDAAAKGAAATVAKTLRDLHEQTHSAVEQSKSTAQAAVSEMLETHGMLRSDTTALFERLREANILLQEVLSGAHENMNEIESTLVSRVAEFVTAMHEVAQKTGTANTQVEQHINAFRTVTAETLTRPVGARHPVRLPRPLAGRGGRADRPQQPAHRRLARRAQGIARAAGRQSRPQGRGRRTAHQPLLGLTRPVAQPRGRVA